MLHLVANSLTQEDLFLSSLILSNVQTILSCAKERLLSGIGQN